MGFAIRALFFSAALFAAAPVFAQSTPQLESTQRGIPAAKAVHARTGMVVAQEARAARVGVDILQRGGNAVDAAVAVGFAMAVTYPRAGNLGGGGFMVIYRAKQRQSATIDYRETAPAAATPTMFLDARGEPDQTKSRDSALAIGVPGTVAGLALAHEKYGSGKFTLADLIVPAIALAREGIDVADDTADSLPLVRDRLGRWPSSKAIFFNADGSVLAPGHKLIQFDLAATLEAIAKEGAGGFYRGAVAEKIAGAIKDAGGIMTTADLAAYKPEIRAAVRGRYRGYDIVSMPPPSSGGVHLVQMLNILEGYDLPRLGPRNARAWHVMIEAMRRAYADRAVFLADPTRVKVPVAGLTSKRYAATLRATISERATPSAQIRPGNPRAHEGRNTTHFSIIDREGNAVANTYTLNFSYGMGLVAAGTGVLLNNELDDFTAKPGASNAFGLVGFEANLPGPGKRPLSSMTPTIVLRNGKPVLVTGSPGGSRIITAVLQQIIDTIDFRMSVDAAVSAPRVHHQWQPDEVYAEQGFDETVLRDLATRGHKVLVTRPATAVNSVVINKDGLHGAADARTRGATAAGY